MYVYSTRRGSAVTRSLQSPEPVGDSLTWPVGSLGMRLPAVPHTGHRLHRDVMHAPEVRVDLNHLYRHPKLLRHIKVPRILPTLGERVGDIDMRPQLKVLAGPTLAVGVGRWQLGRVKLVASVPHEVIVSLNEFSPRATRSASGDEHMGKGGLARTGQSANDGQCVGHIVLYTI
jgi:hypothetical protein